VGDNFFNKIWQVVHVCYVKPETLNSKP
jgi:hypothetical protein